MYLKQGLSLIGLSSLAAVSYGGTVIDTNLSAGNIAIVNIDATADGASNWTGNQDLWQDPFNVDQQPLEVTLGPGTYQFQLVDPAAAAALNPNLTAGQLGQIYTGWTYNSPWITDYFVWDSSALTTPGTSDLFAGAVTGQIPNLASYAGSSPDMSFDNGVDAYNAAVASGVANEIWLGGRFSGPEESSYTITQTETLVFAIPDWYVPDNTGGDSVLIRSVPQAVPEPSSLLILAPAVGLLFRRRKPAQ